MSAPVTTITIGDRVAKGAALLDEGLPGWYMDVDLDRLNLASPCRCILGQLFTSPGDDDPNPLAYSEGLDALEIDLGSEYGFDDSGEHEDELGRLATEWKRLILARREAVRP